MRTSRRLSRLASITAAIFVITSCGGGGDSPDPPTQVSTKGTITGRVIDADSSNGGVANVSVAVQGATAQTVTTNSSGAFTASNLEAGAYTLQLSTPANFILNTGETGTRSVTVSGGNTATASNFTLARPKGSLSGSVRSGTTGLAGASLSLTRGGFSTRPIITTSSGSFQLTDVPTGNWNLTVAVPTTLQLAAGETGSRTVAITTGQTTAVTAFSLETKPVSNIIEVHVQGATFSPANVTINAGQTVRWILDLAGDHTITPQNPNQPGVWTRAAFATPGVVLEHTFTVAGQTYNYRCEPHSIDFQNGMVGSVKVN